MLEVANVSVSYGRHRALDCASVSVGKGEICVILGANGAGKSTLLKTVAGLVRSEPGSRISMNDKAIAGMKPHRIVEEGIALVPEGRGIFGDLTVAENLQLGAFANRARNREAETLRQIYELFPRLAERKKQIARTMSGGEQQMVAIGRALMSKPDILMLDEPSLGLSPLLSQELFRSLTAVAGTGVGILLVEQNARQSLKIANRGYLIENGHVTGEASAAALMTDPAVVNAYLGGTAQGAQTPRARIVLPPATRLPLSVDALGRAIGDLATRAGRIQQAFVRSMRREADMPSAFVGRYDPKAGGDPWVDLAVLAEPHTNGASRPAVSADASRLGNQAASLAMRAQERLSAHVAMLRLNAPRPSGFDWLKHHEDADASSAVSPPSKVSLSGSHGRIGHNSGAAHIEDESVEELDGDAPAPSRAPSIADLVARASEIQTRHVIEQRKRLTAFTIPARPSGGISSNKSASKKRKKRKET